MSHSLFAVWRVPVASAREELSVQMERLSRAYGAPRFCPHVTLLVGASSAADESVWRKTASELASRFEALTLSVAGVGHGPELEKTLFLEVVSDERLSALQRRVSECFASEDEYHFAPHLSLLYKKLPSEVRVELASTVTSPTQVRLDTLVVMVPDAPDWSNVEGWRTVCDLRLGASE